MVLTRRINTSVTVIQTETVDEIERFIQKYSELCGRTKELQQIFEFIYNCIHKLNGGILYICGSPGTGKTASVKMILKLVTEETENCSVWTTKTTLKVTFLQFCRFH